MSNNHIHIDRIHINGQGIPPPVAQAAAQSLGQELLTGLAQQHWSLGKTRSIANLQLGTISVKNARDVSELRQAIAQAVIQEIITQSGRRQRS